jgi:hypothetical protein
VRDGESERGIEKDREGEKGIEVKGSQSKPNPSPSAFPNYVMRACKKGRGTRTVPL